MSASVQAFKNTVLTQIAVKRLSGKAQVSGLLSLAEEKHGSTPQTLGSTVLAELVPNNPQKIEWLIQSSSIGANGTAMYVEFDLETISDGFYAGTEVSSDAGAATDIAEADGGTSYYHAYAIKLPSDFTSNAVFTDAGTPTAVGSSHFTNGYNFTGSLGRLQLIPEFASDNVDNNPYKIQIFNAATTEISDVSPMDWYVDTYAGILFIQDPINDATNLPVTLKGFLYVGKYQDEVGSGDSVDLHISDGTNGFSLSNAATASFESGSAGITVSSSNDNKITIGNATDNVTFNNGLFTGDLTIQGDITAENYIVSSTIMYMTSAFSAGNTIFGDTNNDTHQFTGSLSILHTGSNSTDYGFYLSGSNFYINGGGINTLTLGNTAVASYDNGYEFTTDNNNVAAGFIISQSQPSNTYNSIKIGDVSLFDNVNTNDSTFDIVGRGGIAMYNTTGIITTPVFHHHNDSSLQLHKLYIGTSSVFNITNNKVEIKGLEINDGIGLFEINTTNTTGSNLTINPTLIHQDGINLAAETKAEITGSHVVMWVPNGVGNSTDKYTVFTTGSTYFVTSHAFNEVSGSVVNLEISASSGFLISGADSLGSSTSFSLALTQTASFLGSDLGMSVIVDPTTNTITFGSASDNLTVNNITSSGIFISNNGFSSFYLGTHNVGADIGNSNPLTGSGIIISQSNLPANNFNMLKIGDIEFVDYSIGIGGLDSLVIDTKGKAFMVSSSAGSGNSVNPDNYTAPIVSFADYNSSGNVTTDHIFYSSGSRAFGFYADSGTGSFSIYNSTGFGKQLEIPNHESLGNLYIAPSLITASNFVNAPTISEYEIILKTNTNPTLNTIDRNRLFSTSSAYFVNNSVFLPVSESVVAGIAISGSGGTFSVPLNQTASIFSGSAGISVIITPNNNTITIGSASDNVTFNNITANGDLTVLGTTTTISTANLLVEDAFIQLASGSGTSGNGGIVVERAIDGTGTALFWDETNDTWTIDATGADASSSPSVSHDAAIAFVSRSAGLPGTAFDGPVVVGADDTYKKGQFYVDTSDDYGLYVFL